MDKVPVITLDGPSGSGKGTLGQRLAKALGWHFLDSGALYRALALVAQKGGIGEKDVSALTAEAEHLPVSFLLTGESARVILDGEDVTEALRSETCARLASQLAAKPEVRKALLARQHAFRQPPGLVADGRDMGTVVFPDALLKVYLTASPQARARRRYQQLKAMGISANLESILQDMQARDARDEGRAEAPMKPAPDAVVVDTTAMNVDEVFAYVKGLVAQRLGRGSP
ncbi:MAG: (d)CMP kinase [Gammaproteobacteria bacterium]|nr:MAG: (d)CMP kinase [Gammaproteobacteria bacterium]